MTEDARNWISLAIALAGTVGTAIAAIAAIASYINKAKREHQQQVDDAIHQAREEMGLHARHDKEINTLRITLESMGANLLEFKTETRKALEEIFQRLNR